MRDIQVVGAVIECEGLILCALRGGSGPLAGLWEFPGGKIEAQETAENALKREISEELACEIEVGKLVAATRHTYEFATITLTTFRCRIIDGEPLATEHAQLRWVGPSELLSLEWAPADLPAVSILTSQ